MFAYGRRPLLLGSHMLFTAATPGAHATAPIPRHHSGRAGTGVRVWAVLAWVRHEIQHNFFNQTRRSAISPAQTARPAAGDHR